MWLVQRAETYVQHEVIEFHLSGQKRHMTREREREREREKSIAMSMNETGVFSVVSIFSIFKNVHMETCHR